MKLPRPLLLATVAWYIVAERMQEHHGKRRNLMRPQSRSPVPKMNAMGFEDMSSASRLLGRDGWKGHGFEYGPSEADHHHCQLCA